MRRMPRDARVSFEQAHYHVMNRGKNHRIVFHDARYYGLFVKYLREAARRYSIAVHAYCLMPNHFHLFLSTPLGNISEAMQYLENQFVRKHNHFRGEDGSLFKGRFKSKLVTEDSYALYLTRYIHRNPTAGSRPLVSDLTAYPWSSYSDYLSERPSWISRDLVRELMGSYDAAVYRNYVESDQCRPRLADYLWDWDLDGPQCTDVVSALCRIADVPERVIHEMQRGRGSSMTYRWVAVVSCRDHFGIDMAAVSDYFRIYNRNTVPKYRRKLAQAMSVDPRLRVLVEDLKAELSNW